MSKDCMYHLPHELTGLGALCGLLQGCGCNHYGKRCVVFEPHTKESREALKQAIRIKQEELKRKGMNND